MYSVVERIIRRLLGDRPKPAPAPAERSRYGSRVDSVVLSHALDRIDELAGDDIKLEKVEKLVSALLAERLLGLSDMRPVELKRVLTYIRRKRNGQARTDSV